MRRLWTILCGLMLCIVAGNALMAQSGSGFYVEPGGTMTVENNIIIYNSGQNINVTVSSFNAVTNATNILMDVENDFRLRAYSPAINFGNNQYVTWLRDFMDTLRIINEVVDLGAFEYPVWARAKQYAIHQVGTSGLTFCNNIIVNNPEHYAVTNVTSMPSHNILSDSVPVLKDAVTDFSIMSASPAVDAGQNSCNSSATDLQDGNRIINNTIDIGAYEYVLPQTYTNTVYAVWQNSEAALTFCNNIDINNCVWSLNTNITTLSSNIVTDNDSLFVDNVDDYRPRPESEAVDAGQDACNQVEKDLADKQRVMGEQIDIGAFEQYLENEDSLGVTYVVHQLSNHTLLLCNNVIVNNPEHHDVTNIVQVPFSNILSDSIPIFSDALLNFKPYYSSPAVDAGDNSCNGLPKDIDTVPRISGPAIDVGAFELPVRDDSSYTGGGSGGGAYYYAEFHHSTVHQNSGDSLVLCNNIIINNNWLIPNAYENADTICNILTDTDSLFMDNEIDYMPRPESQAVNTGCNDCNEVETDLSKKNRIYQDIIDIGAFEQYMPEDTGTHYNIVVHQVGVGTLVLCNNVIVNNLAMELATNIEDIPTNNILSDSIPIFSDEVNNFTLWSHSPAVDAGSNGCCLLPKDIKDNPRISNEVIDIGAFEYLQPILFTDTTFVVLQQDGMTLQLCNNIVINNAIFTPNTNIENVPNNNIIEDNDSVFTDNHWNYLPLPQSIAVNRGENSCNSVVFDLSKHPRIMADTIDVGAFEQYEAVEDTFLAAAVLGDTLHQLQLYNNIIINNPGHTDNVYGNVIGDHNLTQDVSGVFVDDSLNFKLLQQSPAIDAGDNQRVTWALDIKDDPRVACGNIVDQGAFEYVFDDLPSSLMANEVPTDNCQGYYFELIAPPGAQHYFWSHTNEDTNIVQVSPLLPTEYQVLVSNGGECVDSLSVFVIPQAIMADSMGSPASVGTTFWLSYLRNHFHEPTLTLQVSAEEACTGTVSNPQTGWSSSFSVAAHSVTVVNVPASVAYPTTSNQVGNFGLLVQTSDSVSLYAANYNTSSFDVTNVLPVDAISDEYVLQTYTPMMNAEFVVVATVDNTVVNITPSRALQGGHAAQQTFSVTLQAGQTYLGLSQYGGVLGDLSGTVIQAQDNKPIAVFNGNVCALVPSDNSYTDHLVEQAVGVKYWGRSFALTTTESQNFDVVRVTALRNNTEIRKNGVLMATLQAYQTHEFQLSGADGSCFIETSEPAGVYLYIAGAVQGNADERSDPSMIWIPPTEQKLNDLTFATFDSPGISDHYVNIVIPAASVDDVTFDGVNIGGQFTLLNGNSDYAFIRKYISNGTHTLHCEGGFIAHCYGLGYHESYGYAAGSKAVPLKEQLFVNGMLNTEMPPGTKFCPYEPIDFSIYVNYPCDSVVWNFGDGSPLENTMASVHDYTDPGTYTVAATLYITSGGSVFCSNLYARVKVVEGPTITLHDTVCQGEIYQQNGFEVAAEESGPFTYTRTASAPGQYCDSTYILNLEVLESHLSVEDTICVGNHYVQYGFDITPTETGLYTDTTVAGLSSYGCDSLVILNLMVTPNNETPPAIEGETYPCLGGEYTYAIDSLSGLQDVVWTLPDNLIVLPQQDPYKVSLLLDTYADSIEICVAAAGGCGTMSWCRAIYPQPYNFVQISDTICQGMTAYSGYGFELMDISDTNDLFYHHDVAAGGCDSTTVLSLVFMPTYQVEDTIVICENDYPYLYHDTLLAEPGQYEITLASIFGCDSTVSLVMDSYPMYHTYSDITVCNRMVWYGTTYTVSGEYDTLLTSVHGCDSLVTLRLTVHYSDTLAVDSVVCRDQLPITWNGVTFTEEGTETALLENVHGCDSLVVMTLEVRELTARTLNVYVLENDMPYVINGYVYEEDGEYVQHLTNAAGCDSTLTVVLSVMNNVSNSVDSTICAGNLPFVWNGVTFSAAGTQIAVLQAATGADSVLVMNVTVIPTTYGTFDTAIVENALPYQYNDSTYVEAGTFTQYLTNVAGCDSILTLTLTVFPNVTVEVDSVICESALPFTWNDSVFTEAGTKTAVITASTGADSTVVMTLTLIPTAYGEVNLAIVENELPYTYNDSVYQEAGVFTQHYTSAAGCDSILMVNLTVYPNVTVGVDSAVCEGGFPIIWNDSVFTEAAVKSTTILASTGADSMVVMTVVVIPTVYQEVYVNACDSLTWINGVTYYGNTDTATCVLTAASGCDSVVTMHLTMYFAQYTQFADTACDSYTWNDMTYTQSGDYTQTFTGANGCDSTVTLHLTVKHSTDTALYVTVIENNLPYSLNGSNYGQPGDYTQYFTNAVGCDSTLTLHLTVFYNVTNQVDTTVCAADMPFTWHGHTFTAAGSHTVTLLTSQGADSVVTYVLAIDNIGVSLGNVVHITCYGDSTGSATAIVTGGQSPMSYLWTNAANETVSTTTAVSNVPAGGYTFTVTDHVGCVASLPVTLNVLNGPIDPGTISADQEVCEGEMLAPFTGTAASGTDYSLSYWWEFSTNGTDWTTLPGISNTQNYTYPNPATFSFSLRRAWITQECGMFYSNIVTVSVWPNFSDTVSAEVCQGDGFEGYGFDIAPEQTMAAGEVIFEQHYTTGHCDSVIVLLLTVHPQHLTELEDVICEGDGYNANGFVVNPIETVGLEELHRELNLQTQYGCDSVVHLTLTVIDTALRIVLLTEDFCEDQSMELMVVTPMPDYIWSTGESAPTITVTSPGYYSVTATQGDCSASARVMVAGCDYELVLPNAITPSRGDGVNDWFCLPEAFFDNIALFEISILNRWGEQVYYSTDKHFKWNGEYRGSIQYQTIYNYVIRYTDTSGRPYTRTGSITVL